MKKITTLVMLAALAGCGKTLPTDTTFNTSNQDGLVVIGIDAGGKMMDSVILSYMDPETCVLQTSGDGQRVNLRGKGSGKEYYTYTLKPGTWILSTAVYTSGNTRTTAHYSKGGLAFDVEPGKIIHVGELQLGGRFGGPSIGRPDRVGAATFMKNFPNITVEPQTVRPWITPYATNNKSDDFSGCRPKPVRQAS